VELLQDARAAGGRAEARAQHVLDRHGNAGERAHRFARRDPAVHVLRSGHRLVAKQADEGADRRFEPVDLRERLLDRLDAANPARGNRLSKLDGSQIP